MDSKALKMPISESDKMEASVLGCRLSEKVEFLPIKKRRFLFRDSSPPFNTSSSEATETVAASLQSSSQDANPKPDANCPPVASLTVSDIHQSENIDRKPNPQKLVMYSKRTIDKKETSDTPVASGTVEFKAKTVKVENMSAKETDLPISKATFKDVASSTTVDNSAQRELECAKRNEVTSNTQKSAALDDRLNWDLNTVMAWEEQLECDRTMNGCKDGKSEHPEQESERGSVSENIGNNISPVKMKSLIPKTEGSELEECKPVCNGIRQLLPPVINSASPVDNKIKSSHNQHADISIPVYEVSAKPVNVMAVVNKIKSLDNQHADGSITDVVPSVQTLQYPVCEMPVNVMTVVNKINSLHNQHADSSIPNVVPSAATLEYPVCNISAKPVSVMAAGTDFTFMPSGFGQCIDKRAYEENFVSSKIVASGSNVNHSITNVQKTENDRLSLSLVTTPSFGNGVHQNGSTFDEDDKANVKRVVTSNGIAMDSLISSGTERFQNVLVSSRSVGSGNYVNHAITTVQTAGNEKLSLSLVTPASTENVPQNKSVFDDEDDKAKVKRIITSKEKTIENAPAVVCSMHDVVCSDVKVALQCEKSRTDVPRDTVGNNNQEVCDYENFEVQAGSEVDNIDEVSFGYTDSQFEDGEFRESSIQTWEGNEGEDREIEHSTEYKGPHENVSLKSIDVGSQKGTDEISSVLLPEKLDSSDQISGCEPNMTENCTTEVNMKDACQSHQWKMNVSGSDPLPENFSSSSNVTNIKDVDSMKFSYNRRDPSTRDTFLGRSRFRMQGSSSNADDSASRPVRDSGLVRSIGRGKYTRGGGTWDRSPPFPGPSFRRSLPEDVDNLTDKVGGDPSVTRGPFRSRLMVNSEEDEFRARLGLRPSGDTSHNRFVNVGRGRSLKYGSRNNDVGPRERYYGHPANDEHSMDFSHSFPARRRCFSPTRRHSGSTSPVRLRTRSPVGDGFRHRSRSPNMRIRREPNYRNGFEPDHVGGYNNLEQSRNNSPPSSRLLKYKQRSLLFDRRSPPPSAERLGFYDSSRKTKPNENYRSSRFSELHGGGRDGDVMDNGFRRGGFVRPYDTGRPVKHIQYNEENGYGPPVYDSRDNEGMEFRGRGNPKPYVGTDARFRDLPRRPREDRDKW